MALRGAGHCFLRLKKENALDLVEAGFCPAEPRLLASKRAEVLAALLPTAVLLGFSAGALEALRLEELGGGSDCEMPKLPPLLICFAFCACLAADASTALRCCILLFRSRTSSARLVRGTVVPTASLGTACWARRPACDGLPIGCWPMLSIHVHIEDFLRFAPCFPMMPPAVGFDLNRLANPFGADLTAGAGCEDFVGARVLGAGAGLEPLVDGSLACCLASNAALNDMDAFVFAATAERVMLERRRPLNGEAGFGAAAGAGTAADAGAAAGAGLEPLVDG